MPIKVGVTGGIGSGKSFVCKLIEKMGYPVYYSDTESKRLTNTHPEIRKGLIELVGTEVFQKDGLNRPFLASKLFSDEELRLKVNQLIHPIVRADFANWATQQNSPIVFNEAAILFETGAYKTMDFMILVTSDLETRIQRTMARDGISREAVLSRIDNQWKDDEKIELADFVIENDDGKMLLTQVEQAIESIKEKYKL